MRLAAGLLVVAAVWLSSVACGSAQSQATAQSPAAAQAQSPAPGASDPVATVGGTPITRADLDALVAPQIAKLDEQAHQIRRAQLDELIAEKLLDAEAKARNVSREALEKAEISDEVTPPTQADLDAFVAANRARLPGDPAALMPQIRQYLTEQRRDDAARGVSRRAARQDEGRSAAQAAGCLPRRHRSRRHAQRAARPTRR